MSAIMIDTLGRPDKNAIPGGDPMEDIIREFVRRLISELSPILDWAIRNWALTLVVLFVMIYWAGRRRARHR